MGAPQTEPRPTWLDGWKGRARRLKREVYALYLAVRDPRCPWYARLFAGMVVAYVFSPIDLIPDFIPVIGYLDDLILVPLGVMVAIRLIPPQILAESRAEAGASSRRASRSTGSRRRSLSRSGSRWRR